MLRSGRGVLFWLSGFRFVHQHVRNSASAGGKSAGILSRQYRETISSTSAAQMGVVHTSLYPERDLHVICEPFR